MLYPSIPKPHILNTPAHPPHWNTHLAHWFFKPLPIPLLLIIFLLGCQTAPESVAPDSPDTAFPGSRALETVPDRTSIPVENMPDIPLIVTIPSTKPDRSDDECAQLDSLLRQLSNAEDQQAFAEQHALLLTPQGVGVEIHLISPDVLLDLSTYQIEVRNQRAAILEAFLPVDQLCHLAANKEVTRISPIRLLQ